MAENSMSHQYRCPEEGRFPGGFAAGDLCIETFTCQ
jgi:hypothetical protein